MEKEQMDNIEKEKAKLNKIKQIQQVTATSLFSQAIKEKGIEDFSVESVKSTKADTILLVNVNGNNVLLKVSANVQKWLSEVPKIVDALSDESKTSLEIFDALMNTKLPPLEIPIRLAKDITLKPNKNGKARFFTQGIMRTINFKTVKELELVGMTEFEEEALCHRGYNYPLETLIIADGVKKIGKSAFSYLEHLVSASIPDSVTEIGDDIFEHCESLCSVLIPKKLTKINGMFSSCQSLKNIDIPDTVNQIDSGAFFYCDSLESVKIPEGVTEIGMHSIQHCISLKSIRIPKNVTKIGPCAFQDSTALSSIEFDGTVEQWNKIWKGFNWNVGVPAKTVKCTDGDAEI